MTRARKFKRFPTLTGRTSTSFNAGEIEVLNQLVRGALSSNSPIARSDDFAGLAKKAGAMRAKVTPK